VKSRLPSLPQSPATSVPERSGAVEHPPYVVSRGGGTGLHDRPVLGNGGLLVVRFPWPVKTWSDYWQKRAGLWPRSLRNGRRQCVCQLTDCVSAAVSLAQSRSIVIDMLQLTGMDHSEARKPLPNLD
jgi:hypothetical protein